MAERGRFEAERSAWIKGQRWLDRAGAARRAEVLARRARQRSRTEAGLGDTAFHETETKTAFHRWTRHDDSATSALGLIAWVIVFGIVTPIWFGVAWLVSTITYRAGEAVADRHRLRAWPYLAAAAAVAVLAAIGRPLGWDLWAVHALAQVVETITGGWIAPAVLSRWYAAGWVSWHEIQVALGLLHAGWLVYAWGWEAPAVRRSARQDAKTSRATGREMPRKTNSVIHIISKGEQA
ncbi:hypothetical protein QFZ53_002814 [Microbacterium natoriense]|uniref:DUF2637 domain-containing protein n=1 Tax=Microbacterium natoriense TaxID=284570 RepID=A0AAW8EZ67_9MICO|nr:hypothetical protein [Microbacterium natoriense]MDQ0648618.1 hypothetical protein [Microbacterium natoriense]